MISNVLSSDYSYKSQAILKYQERLLKIKGKMIDDIMPNLQTVFA